MFQKLKIKRAKKSDVKKIHKLFLTINPRTEEDEIEKMVEEKQIILLKKRKKLKAAFAYSIIGILGVCSFMYVKKIVVDQDERGKGVGSYVLSLIKQLALVKRVNFGVLYSLKKAVRFYKKNRLKNYGQFFWWKN